MGIDNCEKWMLTAVYIMGRHTDPKISMMRREFLKAPEEGQDYIYFEGVKVGFTREAYFKVEDAKEQMLNELYRQGLAVIGIYEDGELNEVRNKIIGDYSEHIARKLDI